MLFHRQALSRLGDSHLTAGFEPEKARTYACKASEWGRLLGRVRILKISRIPWAKAPSLALRFLKTAHSASEYVLRVRDAGGYDREAGDVDPCRHQERIDAIQDMRSDKLQDQIGPGTVAIFTGRGIEKPRRSSAERSIAFTVGYFGADPQKQFRHRERRVTYTD